MIINPNLPISHRQYEDPLLREAVADALEKMQEADILAAALWAAECQFAQQVVDELEEFKRRVYNALDGCKQGRLRQTPGLRQSGVVSGLG